MEKEADLPGQSMAGLERDCESLRETVDPFGPAMVGARPELPGDPPSGSGMPCGHIPVRAGHLVEVRGPADGER